MSAVAFVYFGALIKALGYLARDELRLRLLLLTGSLLNVLYYFYRSGAPMWDPVVTNGLLALVNLAVIAVVVRERSTVGMGPVDLRLFAAFEFLTPGQFRTLIRRGQRYVAEAPEVILVQGRPVEKLYFLAEGRAEAEKGGKRFSVAAPAFLGEVAFLTDRPASATVRMMPGCDYVVWDVADLRALFRRAPALRNGLMAHLNRDLSGKLTASVPMRAG